jgi:hypothetical protein
MIFNDDFNQEEKKKNLRRKRNYQLCYEGRGISSCLRRGSNTGPFPSSHCSVNAASNFNFCLDNFRLLCPADDFSLFSLEFGVSRHVFILCSLHNIITSDYKDAEWRKTSDTTHSNNLTNNTHIIISSILKVYAILPAYLA